MAQNPVPAGTIWYAQVQGDIRGTQMDVEEMREWVGFIGKLLLEGACTAIWVVIAWWLHSHLTKTFPLEGTPRLTLSVIEIVFYTSTIYHLIRLLFRPRKKHIGPRWWE